MINISGCSAGLVSRISHIVHRQSFSTTDLLRSLWKNFISDEPFSEKQRKLTDEANDELIRKILRKVKKSKIAKRKAVISQLIQYCFMALVKDSKTVVLVLSATLPCLQDFPLYLDDFRQFGGPVNGFLLGDRLILFELTMQPFFLDHARNGQLHIGSDPKVRFPDFCLALLRERGYYGLSKAALVNLVRYGTSDLLRDPHSSLNDPLPISRYQNMLIPPFPLLDLLCNLIIKIHKHGVRRSPNRLNSKLDGYIQLLDVVIEACPRFPSREHLSRCNGVSFELDFFEPQMDQVFAFLDDPMNPKTYRGQIKEKRNATTTPLVHLCRNEIRKTLHKNWKLPKGIYDLGLPKLLEKFLDVKC